MQLYASCIFTLVYLRISVHSKPIYFKNEQNFLKQCVIDTLSILQIVLNGSQSVEVIGIHHQKKWLVFDMVEEFMSILNYNLDKPVQLSFYSNFQLNSSRTEKKIKPPILLLIMEYEDLLFGDWVQLKKFHKLKRRKFVSIILVSESSDPCKSVKKGWYFGLMRYLWREFELADVLIHHKLLNCVNSEKNMFFIYNPFSQREYFFSEISDVKSIIITRLSTISNLHKYPVKFSVFERQPTAVLKDRINETCYRKVEGMDGHVLETFSHYLNITPEICEPNDHLEFGYLDNGSFTGSLGDVINRKADFSFNSRFIKEYDSSNIEFTTPIVSDSLCLVVPKASRIPKWLTISLTLTDSVKVFVLISFIASYIFLALLKKINITTFDHHEKQSCVKLFFDMMRIFISLPVPKLPATVPQRIFTASCILFSLVLASAFQGQIVTVISNPLYYKDLNSLEQLEQSGLSIRIGSKDLEDTFPQINDSVMDKLRKRIVFDSDRKLMEIIIGGQLKSAALIRQSTVETEMLQYAKLRGIQSWHIVQECPRYYLLAYIARKGSPLLPSVNEFLAKIVQSGLINLYANSSKDIQKQFELTKSRTLRVFSISDLQLSFYILAIGLLSALIIFVFEMGSEYLKSN